MSFSMQSDMLVRSTSDMEEDKGMICIAVDGGTNSLSAFQWAMDNLLHKNHECILVHIRSKALNSLQNVLNEISEEDQLPKDQELQQLFLLCREICAYSGMEAKEVVLYDNDVASALIRYIINNNITGVVIGACTRNDDSVRKFQSADVLFTLLKSAPESCALYVISSGEVQHPQVSLPETQIKVTSSEQSQSSGAAIGIPKQSQASLCIRKPNNEAYILGRQVCWEFSYPLSPSSKKSDDMSGSSFSPRSWRSESSNRRFCLRSSNSLEGLSDENPQTEKPNTSPAKLTKSTDHHSTEAFHKYSASVASALSGPQSFQSTDVSSEGSILSRTSSNASLSPCAADAEMNKLKLELEQCVHLYNSLNAEPNSVTARARDIHRAATQAPKIVPKLAKVEARKIKKLLTRNDYRYARYTIEDIEFATDYFAIFNKLTEDGYGPVYKGKLDDRFVAIKVFKPNYSQGHRQFQREVEVLSTISHPHMIRLLGACIEYGCIVYEYMENGSLEDRLFRKYNTSAIPWRHRFRIASEIATGLNFLHEIKPEPLVHRDLKPANILLSRDYMSKISDMGLARLVANNNTESYLAAAAAVGTFCYIDPEYKKTGNLDIKSDWYSLGIMLLQLLTAKPPMGLSCQVQEGINNGTFADVLDPELTDWPIEEALSLAKLALKCCELRKDDRPDLASVVLPELNRLRDFANEAGKPKLIPKTSPQTSVPELHNQKNQINARRGWQHRTKYLTKFWSFKSNTQKEKNPVRNQTTRRSNETEFFGCWSSFTNCAPKSHAPIERLKSFS